MKNIFFSLLLTISSSCLYAKDYKELKTIGKLIEKKDLSAIECLGSTCFYGSDEINELQALEYNGIELTFMGKTIKLGEFEKECDIEALAHNDNILYAIGSHSLNRKDDSYFDSRYRIFKITLNSKNEAVKVETKSLNEVLIQSKLTDYFKKPTKDRGIDIEGMAYYKGDLYFGFRAPVIKGLANILKLNANEFFNNNVTSSEVISVDLAGYGIRSLDSYNDHFYIVSGQTIYEQTQKAQLYKLNTKFNVVKKYYVPKSDKKLEGVFILNEKEVLLLYDSLKNGSPILLNL